MIRSKLVEAVKAIGPEIPIYADIGPGLRIEVKRGSLIELALIEWAGETETGYDLLVDEDGAYFEKTKPTLRDKIITACRAADAVHYEELRFVVTDENANKFLDEYQREHPDVFEIDTLNIDQIISAWGDAFALRDMP